MIVSNKMRKKMNFKVKIAYLIIGLLFLVLLSLLVCGLVYETKDTLIGFGIFSLMAGSVWAAWILGLYYINKSHSLNKKIDNQTHFKLFQ